MPVKHKHAYKKRPQFKEITKDVPYTVMEKKIEMRPVEETFTRTVMKDKTVEKPRVVMHTMERTRQVPVQMTRSVMQQVTTCKKVRKDVPIVQDVACPCA